MTDTSGDPHSELDVTAVVVTLNRPDFLRTCLQHLERQTLPLREIIVVDASPGPESAEIVKNEFPAVSYLRNPRGPGSTGYSRNIGLATARGHIVAFVDDDAFAFDDWVERLCEGYSDPDVGGVGGRASNGREGEEHEGLDDIGRLHADGTLSGNFAANPHRRVEVDHLLGANMSFRRAVLESLGGIRDGYPGTCLREETDLAFRVKNAGWKLMYEPLARVDHVAAPYPRGQRFDVRYDYFAYRNHIVLLARTQGFRSKQLRRYLRIATSDAGRQLSRVPSTFRRTGAAPSTGRGRTVGAAVARGTAILAGMVVGVGAGWRQTRLDRSAVRSLEDCQPSR